MRIVKTRLRELLPDVEVRQWPVRVQCQSVPGCLPTHVIRRTCGGQVFLDVDNLGNGKDHPSQTRWASDLI